MLIHNIRGRQWWYGSRGWIFPPVFHYMLLLCDRWQQRGSLTKWHLTWKYIWSKGVGLNSSMLKIAHPLTFTNDGCEHSEAVGGVFQQWWQQITSTVANFLQAQHADSCSPLVKMPSWWRWLCWKLLFCSWEFVLSNSVIVLFVSVIVSKEISKRHYFQSDPLYSIIEKTEILLLFLCLLLII